MGPSGRDGRRKGQVRLAAGREEREMERTISSRRVAESGGAGGVKSRCSLVIPKTGQITLSLSPFVIPSTFSHHVHSPLHKTRSSSIQTRHYTKIQSYMSTLVTATPMRRTSESETRIATQIRTSDPTTVIPSLPLFPYPPPMLDGVVNKRHAHTHLHSSLCSVEYTERKSMHSYNHSPPSTSHIMSMHGAEHAGCPPGDPWGG